MEVEGSGVPAPVSYQDYRSFLRALFEMKKRTNPRFSFRRFAAIVGFKSPNYLQLVLESERNLSVPTAELIARRLKLSPGEHDYFVALVKVAAAANETERADAERARLVAIKKIVSREIPSAHREIFSKWYHLLVRELFFVPGAKAEPGWIAKKLNHVIDESEAKESLQLLIRVGFLVLTDEGYKPADPVLDTNDQKMQAAFMREIHAQTLRSWARHLEKLSPTEQELGILNIPISSEKIPELRGRIRRFQDEIIGWVQDEKDADRVVQLGTYLIPYSNFPKKPPDF